MRSYRYLHLDVFTDRLFGGNQLAVVLDARGLGADTMQAIAKEMNFSETTFVLPREGPDTDFRVRIFSPGDELPLAGHPTIGTAYALARTGVLASNKDRVTFGLGVGPTPVSLVWKGDELAFAWMTQPKPAFGQVISDIAGMAASLRLPPAAIAGTGLPIQVVSCGVPFVLVPVATRRAIDNASLDVPAYDRFREAAALDDVAVFIFSNEPGHDKATAYSRCFAPQYGIAEDAATGAASGPLGCYLVHHKVVAPERAGSMLSLQGVNMGRPSHVHMAIGVNGAEIVDVRVGGEAVVAGEGTLYV
jgi:trans-2,3-dihydro-3-hydroxyanthranilate isomerase